MDGEAPLSKFYVVEVKRADLQPYPKLLIEWLKGKHDCILVQIHSVKDSIRRQLILNYQVEQINTVCTTFTLAAQFIRKEKHAYNYLNGDPIQFNHILIGKGLQPLHEDDFPDTTVGILRDNDMVKAVLYNEQLQSQDLIGDGN